MVVMVARMLGTRIVHRNLVCAVAGDFMVMVVIDRDLAEHLAERGMDMFVPGGVLKLVERT